VDVDRADPRPLHRQVAEVLQREVLGRELPPGSVLPSEAELCTRFGVARSVVRQAVAALAADGLVLRRQGRPTVVAAATEHRRLVQRATGLFDQFADQGLVLRTAVLEIAQDSPPPQARAFLAGSSTTRLERVRSADGAPLSYVRTWLPSERVPGLRAEDLTDASLHQVLTADYGLRPVSGRRQVRAVAADERLASALETPVGAPLLLLEGGTNDQHGRPLEWFCSWHRADRVVFDVDVGETTETLSLQVAGSDPRPGAGEGSTGHHGVADVARARSLLREADLLLGGTSRPPA
jgi:GntR family transcriptional regulator